MTLCPWCTTVLQGMTALCLPSTACCTAAPHETKHKRHAAQQCMQRQPPIGRTRLPTPRGSGPARLGRFRDLGDPVWLATLRGSAILRARGFWPARQPCAIAVTRDSDRYSLGEVPELSSEAAASVDVDGDADDGADAVRASASRSSRRAPRMRRNLRCSRARSRIATSS